MKRESEALVEQVVDAGKVSTFRKEIWSLEGEAPLALVRKTLPEGPERGPVVLVHGFAQNRYSWHTTTRSMVNWLALRGWDVWNLDLRGHGRSRDLGEVEDCSFRDYVADVAAVAEALHGEAFFVGHSLGGAAIYGAATEVDMAGVVGIAAPFGFCGANPFMRAICHLSLAAGPALLESGVKVQTRLAGAIIARAFRISDLGAYWAPFSGWWPGSVERVLVEERLRRGFDWTSVRVWLEMSRWAVEDSFDYEEDWAQMRHPLLVMLGDKDSLLPPADGRKAFDCSVSEDRTLREFNLYEDGFHWGHLDLVLGTQAPQFTWPCLEDWMRARQES